jgi:di/tripeptidase
MLGGSQLVTADGGIVRLAKEERASNCLGADDCAGIYVALRMIEAGVRNVTYVFHRQEEAMGKGSNYLANNEEAWLQHFNVCLALDRRGTSDIITSQLGEECASLEFAESLSTQLGIGHKPAVGSFTDSANYTHLIPECSNLSIGYYNEHSEDEVLDLNYLELISQRLIVVDWDSLAIKRTPMQSMFSQFSNIFM